MAPMVVRASHSLRKGAELEVDRNHPPISTARMKIEDKRQDKRTKRQANSHQRAGQRIPGHRETEEGTEGRERRPYNQEEARKLRSKAILRDLASVGIAALGIKNDISEMKSAHELRQEVSESSSTDSALTARKRKQGETSSSHPLTLTKSGSHTTELWRAKITAVGADTSAMELLKAALSSSDRSQVELFLRDRFDEVAQGDYIWLLDLQETGSEVSDMARILLEASHLPVKCSVTLNNSFGLNAHWQAHLMGDPPEVDYYHHQKSCAHRIRDREHALNYDPVSLNSERAMMQQQVAALCGLGGLLPQTGESGARFEGLTITGSTAIVLGKGIRNPAAREQLAHKVNNTQFTTLKSTP